MYYISKLFCYGFLPLFRDIPNKQISRIFDKEEEGEDLKSKVR